MCVFINLTEARPARSHDIRDNNHRFNYAAMPTAHGPNRCHRSRNQRPCARERRATDRHGSVSDGDIMGSTRGIRRRCHCSRERTPNTVDFSDNEIAVTITSAESDDSVDMPGVCFRVDLPGAAVDGCVGRGLLATGLAYGAFQDGDGPIEIIGIVPDEITEVEINGTTLTPTNNVWHYTTTQSAPLQITVRSTDGRVRDDRLTPTLISKCGTSPAHQALRATRDRPITIRRITTRCTP